MLLFTTVDCPIANGYAPAIRELATEYETRGVRFFLVHVDPDVDASRAREHAEDFGYDLPVLLDGGHSLVRALGATITPEAVVLTADGQHYRGRIDDQWRKLGSRAPEASSRDLADAVQLALQGARTPTPHPKAVGCLLPEPRR